MIAVDTNVLIAAHRLDAKFHDEARDVVLGLAQGREPWALPWHCLVEFVANVTNARIWSLDPTPIGTAIKQVESWLKAPTAITLSEGPGFAEVLGDILLGSGVTGGQVHDARIAALCIHHGVSELWTADRDFGRFPNLKTRNPLVG